MRTILLGISLLVFAAISHAEPFTPVPMVIDAPDYVIYSFNHAPLDIKFSLSGKPATIYLVINTMDRPSRPVQNGFKGWHYVNRIDTTIYVSAAQKYAIGNNLTITWDGKGNERSQRTYVTGDYVRVNEFRYYLWGYDSEGARQSACDYIAIGSYWEGQYTRLYEKGTNGMPLDRPWLMGSKWSDACDATSAAYTPRITRGTNFKWQLGDDPTDDTLFQTTQCDGYQYATTDSTLLYGPSLFDPRHWNTFYFVSHVAGQQKSMPTKWDFVPNGNAVMDTTWNDWDKLSWYYPVETINPKRETMLTDEQGENLWTLAPGVNPTVDTWEKLRALDFDDATVYLDCTLQDFYMPDQPPDYNGNSRTNSEINQIYGRRDKQFAVTGHMSCLIELIDGSRLLDARMSNSGTWWEPSRGGDGYVLWANSNGDYFLDNSSSPDAYNPWACIVSDPRNSDNQRRTMGGIDRNGFTICYLTFAGTYSVAVLTQDGSGVDYLRFRDSLFSNGGWSTTPNHGGTICDNGSIFDGFYMERTDPSSPGDHKNDGCCWIGFDSDGGIITGGIDEFIAGCSIVGTVRETRTGARIQGAVVTLLPENRTATTAEDGTFTIDRLFSGSRYTLTIAAPGYQTYLRSPMNVYLPQPTTLEAALMPVSETSICITAPPSVARGEAFWVDLDVTGAESLSSLSFDLTVGASHSAAPALPDTAVTPGTLFGNTPGFQAVNQGVSILHITTSQPEGGSPASGSGTVARVKVVPDAGTHYDTVFVLRLTNVIATGASGSSIDLGVSPAAVAVAYPTVVNESGRASMSFSLHQNSPNPFNPTTTISYVIPAQGRVRLTVYSITGQRVATLVDTVQEAGNHSAVFDGRGMASGMYFYRLETAGVVKTGKMVLMK